MQILGGHPNEVPAILSGKHGLKYAGSNNLDLDAMSAVAKSARKRSLEEFEETVMLIPISRCDISLRPRYSQDCVSTITSQITLALPLPKTLLKPLKHY